MEWIVIKEELLNKMTSEEEKIFVQNMLRLSEITVENLEQNRASIRSAVNGIDNYLRNSSSSNVMVKNMFGFMEDKPDLDKMGTKEYLYFVSDLKIKATVYLLRIHNFLQSWDDEIHSIYETKDSFREKISHIKIRDVYRFFKVADWETVEDTTIAEYVSENGREENSQEENSRKKECERYIQACKTYCGEGIGEDEREKAAHKAIELEQIILNKQQEEYESKSAKKVDFVALETMPAFENYEILIKGEHDKLLDQTYYLFDNSMREIEFTGIGWEWLWRYETGKNDLFRCVEEVDDVNPYASSKDNEVVEGRIHYEKMIKAVVCHMNTGTDVKLASYSKNPFRDIYKYMVVRQNAESIPYFEVDADNHVVLVNAEKCSTITFAMVKKAHTNIFKSETGEKTFSDVILECQKSGQSEGEYQFCLDVLNSSVKQRGDIRAAFQRYVNQFPDIPIQGLQRHIVSPGDEEVVMYKNTCDKVIICDENNTFLQDCRYETCGENVEYRVELDVFEVVWLFQEVSRMVNQQISNKKPEGLKLIKEKDAYFIEYKTRKIEVRGEFQSTLEKYSDEESALDEMKATKKAIENEVVHAIWVYFNDIPSTRNSAAKGKIEFIKSFLENNKRTLPNLGNSVYKEKEGNDFVEFGRKLFLG